MNGRKSILRAKLKAASQQESIQKWKEHFKNLLGNPTEITEKSTKKIIKSPLDIKLRQFTVEELEAVLKKIKSRKAAGLNEIVWKMRKFDNILLQLCSAVHKQNTQPHFLKKSDLGIIKHHRGLTLAAIAAKVYCSMLLNYIQSEIKKILRKNQNSFWRNQSTTSLILTHHLIIKRICAKNFKATLLFTDFS